MTLYCNVRGVKARSRSIDGVRTHHLLIDGDNAFDIFIFCLLLEYEHQHRRRDENNRPEVQELCECAETAADDRCVRYNGRLETQSQKYNDMS